MFSSAAVEIDPAVDPSVFDPPDPPPPPDPPDLAGLSPAELVDRFRALVAERRRLDAEIATFVHRMHLSGRYVEDGHRTVNAWCRASIRCSDSEATTMRRVGRLLAEQPDVAACAATGRLGTMQLERLARAYANPRCGHFLADFLPILLRHAVHLSHREFDLVIDRWTALADIDGSTRAHDQANRDRHVSLRRVGEAYVLSGSFGAFQGAQLERILSVYRDLEWQADRDAATEAHGDEVPPVMWSRTPGQRAADAFMRLALDAISGPVGPETTDFCVNVVVGDDVLTAVHERAVTDATHIRLPDSDPRRWWCETVDGTPLPVADVLAAAVIGHIRRITLDSAGVVVDVGRRRRTLTGPAREAVMAIGGECDWAGCNVSAARCQADHLHPWRHEGRTSTRSTRPRCGQHNRMRNLGWELHRDHDGYWHTLRPDGTEL
jgi:hypothetical protein